MGRREQIGRWGIVILAVVLVAGLVGTAISGPGGNRYQVNVRGSENENSPDVTGVCMRFDSGGNRLTIDSLDSIFGGGKFFGTLTYANYGENEFLAALSSNIADLRGPIAAHGRTHNQKGQLPDHRLRGNLLRLFDNAFSFVTFEGVRVAPPVCGASVN